MNSFDRWFLDFLDEPANPIGLAVLLSILLIAFVYWEMTRFVIKSLRRNLLRTILTSVAIVVLVFVVTLVWSILSFLNQVTAEKSSNFKAIVTERWQIPSQMPYAYKDQIADAAEVSANNTMAWTFYGGTTDPTKQTRESVVFFFCMDPKRLITYDEKTRKYDSMMDGIDELTLDQKKQLAAACEIMESNPTKVVIGKDRLKTLNKKVGERFKVTSINYKDIDLEVEVIGELPDGQYAQSAIMNFRYLQNEIDTYNRRSTTGDHPMTNKVLNLVWLRVPNSDAYNKAAGMIESSPSFKSPAVKCETASSGIASFLDAYRDLLWGMRYLLVPAILITMALVISNAISISVRERRTEMAVLKVLGFSPGQIMVLVLAEALLIGCVSGFGSALATQLVVNQVIGGMPFPIAFFPVFMIPDEAPWWGLTIGAVTSLAGSFLPAWGARSVKVSEVFSRIS
jgi:putative ABC transport system permease protein